jgi:hypothetical protein
VIVEGGSLDDTFMEACKLGFEYSGITVLKQAGSGKFDAVLTGARECKSDLIIIWDADGTVPVDSTRLVISKSLETSGPAMGNRLRGVMEKGAMFRANFVGNWFFAFLWSPILSGKVVDLLCGTKVFPKTAFEAIPPRIAKLDPYGDFSLILSARLLGMNISSVTVNYKKRRYGKTNIRRWSGGLRLLLVTCLSLIEYFIKTKSPGATPKD